MADINWYPGHMARARRLLEPQIRAVDAVIELCDARAPSATRNPDLNMLTRGKARVLVLNKADLANDGVTQQWLAHFRAQGLRALKCNATGGKTRDILAMIEELSAPSVERMRARGANKTVRMMIIGIPNVGKSTFINRIRGRSIAKTSDRPGVTRANQWVKIGQYLELLDTPGMLWPKLDVQSDAKLLAYLGSIRDQIMDSESLAEELLRLLSSIDWKATSARFQLTEESLNAPSLLEEACRGRGWLLSGGRLDTDRGAALVLDEFRAGRVGRISLQRPVKS
ncbi:MAG: ribosome biogenesis GTPase YlqF [Christensenellales bacterium]|jgi:ribosome biogenesis GTPase A